MDYKCVLSVGMRCYTEIYLKQMGLKKFSGPLDALYFNNVIHIIYLLKITFGMRQEYLQMI